MKGILTIVLSFLCLPLSAQDMMEDFFRGTSSYRIPFDYEQNLIIVDLQFQYLWRLNFIVDTGAEHIVLLNSELAEMLDVDYSKKLEVVGSDYSRPINAYVGRQVEIQLGNTPSRTEDIIVLEHDYFLLSQLSGREIHGILGADFFKNLVLQIDYEKKELILHDATKFASPIPDGYLAFNTTIERKKPIIQAERKLQAGDTSSTVRLMLDSGSALPLILYDHKTEDLTIDSNRVGNIGLGLGGWLRGYSGHTHELAIGPHRHMDLIIRYQYIHPGDTLLISDDRDGIIGNRLLEHYDLIVDYVRSTVYLRPNRSWSDQLRYDRSGMTLIAYGPSLNRYLIQDVIPGSPADEAGLKRGDVIRRIGWWPGQWLSLHQLTQRLRRKSGTRMTIVYLRDGQKYKTQITLRDFL